MNTVYAIKDKKTGLYYSKQYNRGTGWWSDLGDAVFYRTEERPARIIENGSAPRIHLAIRKADPVIVPIQLVELYRPKQCADTTELD